MSAKPLQDSGGALLSDVDLMHRLANERLDLLGKEDEQSKLRLFEIDREIANIREKPEWGDGKIKEYKELLKAERDALPPSNSYERFRREHENKK